ncbi:MAG: hypothetical protein ACE5DK_12205, partial [Paracoccaceae bacterium]
VVPSLLSVQLDLAQRTRALRRMLTGKRVFRGQRVVFLAAVLGIAAAFALTLGWQVATGGVSPVFTRIETILRPVPAAGVSYGIFATLSAIICLSAALVSAVLHALGRKRPRP